MAIVVLAAAIGLFASNCSSSTPQSRTAYQSPYDWTNLMRHGDRVFYYQDGQLASQVGVDVSNHQGYIDWNAVSSSGIDFAFVRIGNRGYTEGSLTADEYYSYNIDSAQAAGLDVGVYFFSQAVSADEAREEAEFVLELLESRDLQLPVVFDHEYVNSSSARGNSVSSEQPAACANAFCQVIEAAGYQTMIYGNQNDLARFSPLDGTAEAADALSEALGRRSIWLAEYSDAAPSASCDFAIWQYTNAGQVNGIDTAVDLNIMLPVL